MLLVEVVGVGIDVSLIVFLFMGEVFLVFVKFEIKFCFKLSNSGCIILLMIKLSLFIIGFKVFCMNLGYWLFLRVCLRIL